MKYAIIYLSIFLMHLSAASTTDATAANTKAETPINVTTEPIKSTLAKQTAIEHTRMQEPTILSETKSVTESHSLVKELNKPAIIQ